MPDLSHDPARSASKRTRRHQIARSANKPAQFQRYAFAMTTCRPSHPKLEVQMISNLARGWEEGCFAKPSPGVRDSDTGRTGAAATASDPRRAPCRTRSGSRRLLDRLARLLLRFLEAEHQLVGRVVLEDIADVGGRLDSDLFRRDDLDVVEPLVSVEAAFDRFLAHARDASRARVVGGEGEERTIRLVEIRVAKISAHQLVHILGPRMDVRFGGCDIADLHLGARRRHHLHDPDGPDLALLALVELGLLVALGRQHQRIEAILVAILPEEFQRAPEALRLLRASGVGDLLDPLVIFQSAPVDGALL